MNNEQSQIKKAEYISQSKQNKGKRDWDSPDEKPRRGTEILRWEATLEEAHNNLEAIFSGVNLFGGWWKGVNSTEKLVIHRSAVTERVNYYSISTTLRGWWICILAL